MTDEELVERLLDWPYQGETMAHEAADLIEQLTAERDGLLRCVTDNHVALCRAEVAEAERDRLETALVYAKDYLDLGMEKMAFNVIRHALKGETP